MSFKVLNSRYSTPEGGHIQVVYLIKNHLQGESEGIKTNVRSNCPETKDKNHFVKLISTIQQSAL